MNTMQPIKRPPIEAVARFKDKLDRSGGPSACWPYKGSRQPNGYGRFGRHMAHRFAMAAVGVDPDGKCVLHKCDNPPCCNPKHLKVGTNHDNAVDAMARNHRFRERSQELCRQLGLSKRKLTLEDAEAMRREYRDGTRARILISKYGCSKSTFKRIMRGESYVPEGETPESRTVVIGQRDRQSLTMDQAREIRARQRNGERQIDLAREFGTNRSVVSLICLGRTYT